MKSPYIQLLWDRIRLPIILLFFTFFFGSLGYKILYPEENWIRIFFMTAITLSTVGYGDVLGVERSEIGEIYTIVLILTGMGTVLYAVSSVTAFIVEGDLKNLLSEHSKIRRLNKMKNHYIICGAGDTGSQVVKELKLSGESCVIIEKEQKIIENLKKEYPDVIVLQKDATEEETLKEAKIETAKGLVATLSNDKDNLFLVITARFLNPNLKIVSRAIDLSIESKLIRAGANYVISPNYIGGMRIASILLRPYAVSFLDRMLRDTTGKFRVDEIYVEEGSYLAGKLFKESNIQKYVGVYIFAYYPALGSGECIYNPGPDVRINPGSVLIFIGNPEQHHKIKEMAKKDTKFIVEEKLKEISLY
ncbi:MAG: potassium transporter TrkA [Leptospiraceae bacterium]|nr:MAG: potassium transporter TrkA [Leptospiraceae bacterium]